VAYLTGIWLNGNVALQE